MKFSFKKIGSVLASTAMLSSTIALAAAANFPAPYVAGGAANVAIVHGGADAAYTDLVAVTDVTSYLSSELARQTATGGSSTSDASVSGEATPLYTSGTKLYLNDSINSIKTVLTDTHLPTVLADGSFSGNVDATVSHTIEIGASPLVKFAKEPTSSYDPDFGLFFSSTQTSYLYNATASFSRTVNLTHADSTGEDLEMFGQTYTIASSTTGTDLVLLKSAERIGLTNEDPSAEVTIGGETYTVELITAEATTATVKVTDSSGNSAQKEISENNSKKVGGVTVAVISSGANNLLITATIVVGADKVTLTSGSQVTYGDDNTVLDGTLVSFAGGSVPALSKIVISGYAPTSDEDFLKAGESFVDPVFGTFKFDFAGLNIPMDSTAREEIQVSNSGDDKMTVTFTDHRGNEASGIIFAVNGSRIALSKDNEGRNITVREMAPTYDEEYVVIGNEDEGRLLRVSQITNQSSTASDDKVTFIDVISGETYTTNTPSAEGTATVVIGGKSYTVYYYGDSTSAQADRYIRINHPDSSSNDMVVFPTIETSKGAKLAFYTPQTVNLAAWTGAAGTSATGIKIPDGDEYGDTITVSGVGVLNGTSFNVTCGSSTSILSNLQTGSSVSNVGCAVGKFTLNITASAANTSLIKLNHPRTGASIDNPALFVIEEKDDNSNFEGLVVTLEPGASSDAGIGVDEVVRTWSKDGEWGGVNGLTLQTDSKIAKEADLWGTIVTVDSTDSDQKTATISYPDEQVFAQVYVAEVDAAITAGSTAGGVGSVSELGSVAVTDAEASSVSTKNLIVVGGSCVNSVAAELLGVKSPTCGPDFTAATGVGSGQYLIETFSRTGGKVATLVAGYNAGDTTNAAKALITKTIDTTAGKKYKGSTATDVSAVVAA